MTFYKTNTTTEIISIKQISVSTHSIFQERKRTHYSCDQLQLRNGRNRSPHWSVFRTDSQTFRGILWAETFIQFVQLSHLPHWVHSLCNGCRVRDEPELQSQGILMYVTLGELRECGDTLPHISGVILGWSARSFSCSFTAFGFCKC